MSAATLLVALLVNGFSPSPEAEIWATSLVKGVNPNVALAVHDTETGDIPEVDDQRDRIVSKGNYGRFQVNCTSWKKKLGLRRCRDMLDRHRNIQIGLYVLARFQARFAREDGHGCKCRRRVKHHWTAHYNEGLVVAPGGRGERYGRKVVSKIRSMENNSWIPAGRLKLARLGVEPSQDLLPAIPSARELIRTVTAPLSIIGLVPSSPDRIQASLQTEEHSGKLGTEARGS